MMVFWKPVPCKYNTVLVFETTMAGWTVTTVGVITNRKGTCEADQSTPLLETSTKSSEAVLVVLRVMQTTWL